MLGVRTSGSRADVEVDTEGTVLPGTGGLSVAPNWRKLPPSLVPQRLRSLRSGARGSDEWVCWRLGEGDFAAGTIADGLALRTTSKTHGLIEPPERVTIEVLQERLSATQSDWVRDET
jgi:hypothetical protein